MKRAISPAATAPVLTNIVVPAPVNTDGEGLVGEEVVLLAVPLEGWKLAQVSRVVLLVCMLIERLPRKLPRPNSVET